MVVDVQQLPKPLSGGPWLLERVQHRLGPQRAGETLLEGVSAAPAAGLLGALAGAIGGLL
jgi:hypothetical protein